MLMLRKWPNLLLKSCRIHTARFLKYVWPFFKIIHERVNIYNLIQKIKGLSFLFAFDSVIY